MRNVILFCLCLVCLYAVAAPRIGITSPTVAPSAEKSTDTTDGWVRMPAGARSAYMGIHGGTVPVSLLVTGDGSSLVTFVGNTGNDFLEVLRRTDTIMPSLLNATRADSASPHELTGMKATLLAGSDSHRMPVLYLTGDMFARTVPDQLLPFGFSHTPLSIEGTVHKPERLSPAKHYRLFFEPKHLSPRRGQ